AEFAIMVGFQARPMEMSSPARVASPLWQATHLSEVWKAGTRDLTVDWALQADNVNNAAAMAARKKKQNCFGMVSPPIAQASIKPVPHQIEEELGRSGSIVVHGKPQTDIGPDVLAPAESNL